MGTMTPGDAMAAGPMAPGFFQPFMSPRFPGGPRPTLRMPTQPPVGLPGSQPLLPGTMDPSARMQGHGSDGGELGPAGICPSQLSPALADLGYGELCTSPSPCPAPVPAVPLPSRAPGVRGPWASPSGNSIPYSSSSPVSYTVLGRDAGSWLVTHPSLLHPQGPPGGGGPPGTPIMPSPGGRGPMATVSTMEPHPVNGSLGDVHGGRPQSSPGTVAGLSTAPGTPRDDGEMAAAGTFLHPFPGESVSDCVESQPPPA
uniref:Single stranded DNA binding protein 4 n=1 Tax=Cavia porcellus TaxID=10141 RepID=H0W6B7_CAVPO